MENLKKLSRKNKLNQKNTFEILRENYIYFLAVIHSFFKDKNFLKHFGFIYGLYFIGIFGLLIVDVYHRDDIWRMQLAYPGFTEASRNLSQILTYFFHASYPTIADISPINQLIAIAFLSIASMALVKIVNNKMTYTGLVASLLLGLNPWYLQCLGFKYDSVFMGLATLCATVPFLFIKRIFLFFIVSILFLLCMWNLYQANNGIYIVLSMFVVLNLILQKADLKQICKFLFATVFSFLIAGLIYKFIFFIEPKAGSHIAIHGSVDINMIFTNMKKLLTWTNQNVGTHVVKYLFFISMFFFAISMFQRRKINFISAILFILVFLLIGLFASYGSFLILANFDYHPRTIAQIGGFFAIVAIGATMQKQKIINFVSKCLVFYLSYSLITISSAYANALDAQEKFDQYRIELMISDLKHLLPKNKQEKITTFITSKRQRPYHNNVYSKVLPLISVLTGQIDAQSVYQLRQKDITVTRAKSCKKENEIAKKIVETRFHKISAFEDNCYEIEFK